MTDGRLDEALVRFFRAATDVETFVDGLSKDEFLDDKRTQQAVVLSLLVIGEAAARILDRFTDFATAHPEIPWTSMRGMRNRIAHGYYDIDRGLVWETTRTAVPDLTRLIDAARRTAG